MYKYIIFITYCYLHEFYFFLNNLYYTLIGFLINHINCHLFNSNVVFNDNYDGNTHRAKNYLNFVELCCFDIFHLVRCFCV